MQTQQLWLVAHLSNERVVERVEAVVGAGTLVYIADHPTRCLRRNVDLHETFEQARSASVAHIDEKIHNLGLMRQVAANQRNPHHDSDYQNPDEQRQEA